MTEEQQRARSLLRATDAVVAADLEWMVLPASELPAPLAGFSIRREATLDNATMAANGFPGQTVVTIEEVGRITGYVREMTPGAPMTPLGVGDIVTVGTVAHLFATGDGVKRWIQEVFLDGFLASVGQIKGDGYEVVDVEQLQIEGFHGKAASLFVVHRVMNGMLGSTIIDFQVGRLLGVAFIVAVGRTSSLGITEDLALRLERKIVSVALGSA